MQSASWITTELVKVRTSKIVIIADKYIALETSSIVAGKIAIYANRMELGGVTRNSIIQCNTLAEGFRAKFNAMEVRSLVDAV